MLTLIAESKTMLDEQQVITPEELSRHMPVRAEQASRIIEHLEQLSQAELIKDTKLTPSLALKLRQMLHGFHNTGFGLQAIEAFTGVVFKGLDYNSLASESKTLCQSDVRIVSSLYGLLRPDDIIKPYRLDFSAKAAPDGSSLAFYWKLATTIDTVRAVIDGGHAEILNLLPADAAKCIDWKAVKRFCKVWKADFTEITDGGEAKTPNAGKLKTMRGKLLRQILSQGITNTADLKNIQTDDYICEGTPTYPDHLQFLC